MENSFKSGRGKGLKGECEGEGLTFRGDKPRTESRIPYHTYEHVYDSSGKVAKPNPAKNAMRQK